MKFSGNLHRALSLFYSHFLILYWFFEVLPTSAGNTLFCVSFLMVLILVAYLTPRERIRGRMVMVLALVVYASAAISTLVIGWGVVDAFSASTIRINYPKSELRYGGAIVFVFWVLLVGSSVVNIPYIIKALKKNNPKGI